ncbi:MAG: InlB B-repeat-containing protein [Clostridia bacterium]|nr:InlB B-repeat-containing protein [Clostridia bacterium]
MSISKKWVGIIIGIVLMVFAGTGAGIYFLITNNAPNATTETTSSIENLYTTSGAINQSSVYALLEAIGYFNNTTDTGTYTAHNIATRGTDNSGSTIVFPMGYFVSSNGVMNITQPILWQATYLRNGYLTIWMNSNYVLEYYNDTDGLSNSGFAPGITYSRYSNYSKSTIRDATSNIFTKLSEKFSKFSTIIKSPSAANATWQKTQTEDIRVYSKDSYTYYAHHNGLYSYSGSYTDWAQSEWDSDNPPYNDSFWLPSYCEVYNSKTYYLSSGSIASQDGGLWGLTVDDRVLNGTTIEGTSSSYYCWLRTGYSSFNYMATRLSCTSSLDTVEGHNVTKLYGLRPAAILSLSELAKLVSATVKLDLQSGSGASSVTALLGQPMPAITIPTRTGYTFGGYYTSTNGSGTQYYTATGTSATNYPSSGGPTTLYAKWTANTYYVKYNANGGSGTMSNSTHTYGTASNLTANAFTRTGHTFAGWATSASGAVAYSNGASVSTLTTTSGETYNLYAVWTPNPYTITLKTNDNNLGSVTGGGVHDYGTEQDLIAITASGCGFMYWIDGNGNTYTANPLTITITEDMTLTAIFTNGILNGVACVAEVGGEARINGYTDSDTTIHFSAVAYAGYTFDGWYIYDETTPLSTDWSVDLEKSAINNKLIVAKFSETNAQVNTETNNTDKLT